MLNLRRGPGACALLDEQLTRAGQRCYSHLGLRPPARTAGIGAAPAKSYGSYGSHGHTVIRRLGAAPPCRATCRHRSLPPGRTNERRSRPVRRVIQITCFNVHKVTLNPIAFRTSSLGFNTKRATCPLGATPAYGHTVIRRLGTAPPGRAHAPKVGILRRVWGRVLCSTSSVFWETPEQSCCHSRIGWSNPVASTYWANPIGQAIKRGWGEPSNEVGRARAGAERVRHGERKLRRSNPKPSTSRSILLMNFIKAPYTKL